MNQLLQDIRYAFRQLRRSPGFTLTAVLTLSVGIGATAAVYSVIHMVLLEPLPYADPGNLVGIAFTFPHQKPNAEQAGTSADFVRTHSDAFSSTAVMDDSGSAVNLSVNGGHATQVMSLRVSEGYFRTMGITPAVGRGFLPEEDRPSGARVVVLSHGLWARVFNSDPSVIGRVIHVNEESFTVVGVMPSSFVVNAQMFPGVLSTPEIWQPLQLSPKDPGYDGDNYEMIGRLRPGVGIAHAQEQLKTLQQAFYQQFPGYRQWTDDDKSLHEFRVWKLQDVLVGDVRRSLLTVLGAVVAVLLLACLNLAGLSMARSMRRSREFALRAALGASRLLLLKLLACEGLLLALGGGALALLITRVASNVLLHASPLAIPTLRGAVNPMVLNIAVMVLALGSMCIFALLPAWFLLRRKDQGSNLGGASLGDTISHARLSRSLLVAQVALAMLLVSTASVLLGTFVKLRSLPSGLEPKELTVFQVTLKGDRYASTRFTGQFVAKVLSELQRTPGVDRVAAVNGLPLDRGLNMGGYPVGRPNLRKMIEFRPITAGFFQTMGIPLLAGRGIEEGDRADSDHVVVVGETAAKRWWPGQSPIGQFISFGDKESYRIVGVAADVRMHSLNESDGIVVYGPMAQLSDKFTATINGWFVTSFAVRTAANVNLAAVAQRAVAQADPEIPVARLTTMQSVIDHTIQEPRFFSLLASGFSGFALALTVIGLFGLLSYQVSQRTREIGVRMALGADRLTILRTFLMRGVTVASVGVALGLVVSWLTRSVITHLLTDAGVYPSSGAGNIVMNSMQASLLAVITILIATLVASWLPAHRAASVEPMQALRTE